MSKSRKMKKSRVPEFKSYQEEAKFWDTHDTEEFADEWEEVKVKFARPLKMTFSIRLDPKTINKMDKIAEEKGVGPTTLARMWILEKLKETEREYSRPLTGKKR